MEENSKKSLTNPDLCGRVAKNNALIEWVNDYIGVDNAFTGKITIEINVVDGTVKDFKAGHMRREVV
jgi:hypothetical protein